jgi:dipeptide/tripeptide permease
MATISGNGNFKAKQPLGKSISIVFVAVASVLLVPLVAMQFTNEVDWDLRDFLIMGVLLAGTGLMLVAAVRMLSNPRYRIVACLGIVFAFLLVWAELAVGIIGTPFAGS